MIPQHWLKVPERLCRTYSFDNYQQSLDFVNKVGDIAEAMDHHPEITFSYDKVNITLTTHDKKKVTDKDIEMARRIEEVK